MRVCTCMHVCSCMHVLHVCVIYVHITDLCLAPEQSQDCPDSFMLYAQAIPGLVQTMDPGFAQDNSWIHALRVTYACR